MTLPLAMFASEYNSNSNNNDITMENKNLQQRNNNINNGKDKNTSMRRTIKNKKQVEDSKIQAILKSMDEDSDDDSNLADYTGGSNMASNGLRFPPFPVLNQKNSNESSSQNQNQMQSQNQNISPDTHNNSTVTTNDYNQLPSSSYANQYYKQYAPYYNQISMEAPDEPKSILIEKLNHIIHLLEEQQDMKTGNILEELILYAFLGVFVIYVIDTFTKSGKYTR